MIAQTQRTHPIHNQRPRHFRKNRELFFLSLPAIFVICVFAYLPMLGIVIAFKDINYSEGVWSILSGGKWVGFENLRFFFESQDAFRVTRNTILLNAAFIVTGISISVVTALMLNELGRKAVKRYQTVFFFPYFLSWIVVGYLVFGFLHPDFGVINRFLAMLGRKKVNWYGVPGYWPAILIITYLWKNVGYTAIIFYTGVMGIDTTYYEAAEIDGAKKLQQTRYITIPMLMPLIVMMALLSIGKIFYADFGLFFFVPRDIGALYPTTNVIDTYVYRSLKVVGDLGMASAAGLYQSFVGFVLVLVSNFIVRKVSAEHALF
jgi:putative aldouronate transport system permease protein